MEFSLPEFPSEPGAQAAFIAAAISIVLGLAFLVFPSYFGRFVGLESRETRPGAIGELRAAGGFLAGLALATLMFDQPVLYTALGVSLAVAAFGRIISLMSDQAATLLNFLLLVVQVVLAGATLYYFFDVFTPDMQFAMPEEPDARLVFYTYVAFAVIGALMMFAPRIAAMISGLQAIADSGVTSIRSAGGFAVGASIVAIMLVGDPGQRDMPFAHLLYLNLSFASALLLAVLGRLIALALNRGNWIYAVVALAVEGMGAFLVLSYVMGMM